MSEWKQEVADRLLRVIEELEGNDPRDLEVIVRDLKLIHLDLSPPDHLKPYRFITRPCPTSRDPQAISWTVERVGGLWTIKDQGNTDELERRLLNAIGYNEQSE